MKIKNTGFVIIAKDGWPLEQFEGRPIRNFFRRLFLASHKECYACWHNRHLQQEAQQPAAQEQMQQRRSR